MADTIADECVEGAAALLLQLDTYARPSEVVQLTRRDIIKPTTKHCKYWGVIFGNSEIDAFTKTGTQDDTVLLDSHDREFAQTVLAWLIRSRPSPDDELFPDLDLSSYEALFRNARQKLHLQQFGLTPHAVQHSGPSADFLSRSRSAAEIQSRGRWKTAKSIQRYQKPGQMLAKMNRIPEHIWPEARLALPPSFEEIKDSFFGAIKSSRTFTWAVAGISFALKSP